MRAARGTVYLVGAGPGDPELITVRGLRLLRAADVVIYDRLVSKGLLAEAKAGAELIHAGKKPGRRVHVQPLIHDWMIDRARRGKVVVRLKGGDPFVFGRGGEEVNACVAAGVPCVVVPGVSSAISAPAAAGIAVTMREVSRSFAVVTAHSDGRGAGPDWRALASIDTVVVMMGRSVLAETARRLMDAGRAGDTPAACISNATTPRERTVVATLATIAEAADRAGLKAPVVTIVGETVGQCPNPVGAPVVGGVARLGAAQDTPSCLGISIGPSGRVGHEAASTPD
jgi:uroporphyrin-III C-methyltransferase